jgi:RNA polymerase sigma-70 factor (ECF subfamily)
MAGARRQLIERYGGAVRRYLLAAVRNAEAADELFQEFALRFVRGDFRRADPERGRFRDFVKTALYRMIVHYHRGQQEKPRPLPSELADQIADDADEPELAGDAEFITSWRDDLLARTWQALQRLETDTGRPLYTVLRFKAEHAELTADHMAEALATPLGKPLTAAGVRQTLHRARERFAELLLEEVAQSLDNQSVESIEQELIDIGLIEYCRAALQRRRGAC